MGDGEGELGVEGKDHSINDIQYQMVFTTHLDVMEGCSTMVPDHSYPKLRCSEIAPRFVYNRE